MGNFTGGGGSSTGAVKVNGQSSLATVPSNYTNATTSLTNVTGITFSVAANTTYEIVCDITFSVDTNTATPNWAFTGPASPTTVMLNAQQVSATPQTFSATPTVLAFATQTATSTTTTIASNANALIRLFLANGVNAGTVQLQCAAHGAGTVTILAGSSATITQQ